MRRGLHVVVDHVLQAVRQRRHLLRPRQCVARAGGAARVLQEQPEAAAVGEQLARQLVEHKGAPALRERRRRRVRGRTACEGGGRRVVKGVGGTARLREELVARRGERLAAEQRLRSSKLT